MADPSSPEEEAAISQCRQDWIKEQDLLKRRLVLEDDFEWCIPLQGSSSEESPVEKKLLYIGGVDLSFLKEDPMVACAALVVVDAITLNVVHEVFDVIRLRIPYVPGFLAFREAPILLALLNKMKCDAHPFYPQLLMVDGNGLLHPRGFGLACHLGVLADLPTIGIGKNLHHVDGLTQNGIRQLLEARENCNKDLISLTGKSGKVLGVAMRSTPGSSKPVYISIGHRISLDSSIKMVKLCSKFRVPEPIRQADIRSRVFIQKLKGSLHVTNWQCGRLLAHQNLSIYQLATEYLWIHPSKWSSCAPNFVCPSQSVRLISDQEYLSRSFKDDCM